VLNAASGTASQTFYPVGERPTEAGSALVKLSAAGGAGAGPRHWQGPKVLACFHCPNLISPWPEFTFELFRSNLDPMLEPAPHI
jgi:hypothetical protein